MTDKPKPLGDVVGEVMQGVRHGEPVAKPSPRQPGRPRKNNLDYVNIATNLRSNFKFIEFQELSGLDEQRAFATIIAIWSLIAERRATTPHLREFNLNTLARYCWWPKRPEKLIECLQNAGFIDSELNLVNWEQNQPHAKERKRCREYYKKAKTDDT